jgi:hypothetical protein
MTIGTSDLIATAAAFVAVLAWVESFRARRIQESDFNFQRSADIRIEQFQYWAESDLPREGPERDELRFVVKNVGHAFANEINFAVDIGGLLTYAQPLIGLPSGTKKQLTVILKPDPDLSEQTLLLRYRYDDYRRHWGEISLKVPSGTGRFYGQYRGPKIINAKLDGMRSATVLESDVFVTPMVIPRWYDRFTLPFRRWRLRRDHPELFK